MPPRCRRLPLLPLPPLLLALLLLPARGAPAIRTQTQRGLQHRNVHFQGFVLDEVFLHHPADDARGAPTLTRRRLQFDDHPHLRRLGRRRNLADPHRDGDSFTPAALRTELRAVDASATLTRAKVRGLAKLNMANQANDWDYFKHGTATMREIIANGDSYYTDSTAPMQAGPPLLSVSNNLTWHFTQMIRAEAQALAAASDTLHFAEYDTPATLGQTAEYDTPGPATVARREVGIACIKFTRGTDTILAFRDTESPGDYKNIESWLTASAADPVAEGGMTQLMKRHWKAAGAGWGDDAAAHERASKADDTKYRAIVQTGLHLSDKINDFEAALASQADGQRIGGGDGRHRVSLTKSEVTKQGYWPLTKQIVDAVRADRPAGGQLLFTGYSQGGGRAQLARMYCEKKHGETWPVVTFAAVGPACFPRNLDQTGRTNLLDDVDPTKFYADVTDYANFADPWGTGLGQDVGTFCMLGTVNITRTRPYKYCSKIAGYSGPHLMASMIKGDEPIKTDFAMCRYFAHGLPGIITALQDDNELRADGTTAGGCEDYAGWALGEEGKCPKQDLGLAAAIIAVIVLGSVFVAIVVPAVACRCLRCCCFKERGCYHCNRDRRCVRTEYGRGRTTEAEMYAK